jgi:hypothetical protein
MKPLAYLLQFRGTASHVSPNVMEARAKAPSSVLATSVGEDGVTAHIHTEGGREALLESRLVFREDGSFDEVGSILFGRGNALHFRTIGVGRLSDSADPHLRHGTVMWEIDGGEGQFEGATGRITSNFFVSDTGELTDNQLGLIFIQDGARRER